MRWIAKREELLIYLLEFLHNREAQTTTKYGYSLRRNTKKSPNFGLKRNMMVTLKTVFHKGWIKLFSNVEHLRRVI